MPERKNICPDAERIKEEVCKRHGVAMDDLHRLRRDISNEPRNVTIFLPRCVGRGTSVAGVIRVPNFRLSVFIGLYVSGENLIELFKELLYIIIHIRKRAARTRPVGGTTQPVSFSGL